jgi:phage-related protein
VRFRIEYYNSRVLAEIEGWPAGILADYARLVELLMEHGPTLKMPHAKNLGQSLFELRPHGQEGIGRAFYCFLSGRKVTIVHAFIKKTQETPQRDLKIARKRAMELKHG